MDIDFQWPTWGWFPFSDCMAAAAPTARTASPTHRGSNFLTLLLILLVLTHVDQNWPELSVALVSRRLLSGHDSVDFRPRQSKNRYNASKKEFESSAHEVPSGPNPISNR
ncbi:hypothetical protein SAY87_023487 [Trapa incisa]|uniref:Uncharacterized protein n=2 Tax=Trapa TaxID=22665 RepID=A0AAN7KGE4_TRANT|nr:hypothetical protein SAY86_014740 [Trapa natans]KAK4775526.1 hypothetical protein SAY87_023487 [Trapa incisa]